MKLYPGKILRPREHIRDWDDETAKVNRYSEKFGKWDITVGGIFGAWYKAEDIENDFEECPEPMKCLAHIQEEKIYIINKYRDVGSNEITEIETPVP